MLPDGPMIDAHRVTLSAEDDFDGWRDAARGLAEAGVPPAAIAWQVEGKTGDLFGGPDTSPPPPGPTGVPSASRKRAPSAASMPAPPSVVALPPTPNTIVRAPASSAASSSSPEP